jgi:EmrB/QacA subfamily drug resistance transporter
MADTFVARVRDRLGPEVIVGAVFVSAMFMTIMDITVVNTAIPTIGRQFQVPNSTVQWTATGYLVSLALWIPVSGWIGDRFGAKRVLLFSIGIFTFGSVMCALAGNMTELILARVLQGVGGGMLQPVGMALLFRTFPPERRARASQILIIPTAVAPALGPIIGGLLVTHASWRWVFLINIPVGAFAIVFGALFLTHQPEAAPGRFDIWGFLLGGPGLALFLYGISNGPLDGWSSARVLGPAVGGVLLLGALIVVELRSSQPMLDFRLLHDRLFLDNTLVGLVGFGAFLGTLFIVPLYLQEARHFSAMTSGVTTFPEALGVLVCTQIAGRMYARVGPRRLQVGGLLWIGAILFVASAYFGAGTNLWVVRIFMFGLGAGFAFLLISQQAARFATISAADTGRATALASAIQQASSAIGIALLTTVLTARAGRGAVPHPSDFDAVFVVAGCMAIGGALVALRIRDSDAAATMGRGLSAGADEALGARVESMVVEGVDGTPATT